MHHRKVVFRIPVCLLFSFFMFPFFMPAALAAQGDTGAVATGSGSSLTLYGGYGFSHKDLGETRVEVHVIDFIPQYDLVLLDNIGSSWYRGHHSLLVELPLTMVVDPVVSPMVGINILGAWTFDADDEWQPYFFGGGGILYTSADIPGLGSEVNGNWQFGGGVRYRLASGNWLKFEYRFHHISNAGTVEPNVSINSSKFLIGYSF